MRHKVSDIEGALLDAAVAKAEGWSTMPGGHGYKLESFCEGVVGERIDTSTWQARPFPWSTEWSLGGPILERERIGVAWFTDGVWRGCAWRNPTTKDEAFDLCGRTPLLAGMRAYVASKFGQEVELP